MRHKWSNKLDKMHVFAKCLRCGIIKETHYPMGMMYYFENSNNYYPTYAPPCKILKEASGEARTDSNNEQAKEVCEHKEISFISATTGVCRKCNRPINLLAN